MFKDMVEQLFRKVSTPVVHPAGPKLAKKAFLGTCTLRTGVGAAGRLALEGKLGKKRV